MWEERYVALILRRTTAYQIFVTIYVLSADGGGICGISRSRSLWLIIVASLSPTSFVLLYPVAIRVPCSKARK